MKPLRLVLVVAVALGLSMAAEPPRMPAELAGYRTWPALLKEPLEVPLELAMQCETPSPKQWADALKAHGPHTKRFIRVFGNPKADPARRLYPAGSVIAKEKLISSTDAYPEGVGFMVKRAAPAFRETDGWEFLYFPPGGDQRETQKVCASCHKNAEGFVFGTYPR